MSISSATRQIKIQDGQFLLDEQPFFLYSGEIHYFRMPEKFWKIHLEKARQAGLNTVSSYIPWCWHEYEEGKFDFEGKTHPQRNFLRFLNLVQDAGLYFSARVGPVSNAELVGEGIPEWLLKNHPEIYVQRSGINNLPHALLLSYLNPTFQKYVQSWYDQVLPIVSKYQIHQGGNIIFVQLCNEIGMIHWLHKASDDSEFVTRMYWEFLKDKYSTIQALNESYSTHYPNFEEIQQPKGEVALKNLKIFFEWALFYRRYYALYYSSLAQRAKKHSISVPFSANVPQFYDYDVRGRGVFSPMTTSLYRDFPLCHSQTVMGGAYQMRRLDFENFHDIGITTEIIKTVTNPVLSNDVYAHRIDFENFHDLIIANESVHQLARGQVPIVCAELQTGVMRDRPRIYPADVELNVKTSVAHGLNGINCYMFSSGRNPRGVGAFGSYHDWQAPVSLEGKEREHLNPLKEWGKFLKKYGTELARSHKLTDTTIGFYLPYYATEYFTGSWTAQIESVRTNFFFDGYARLLQLAGFNFSISDLLRESEETLSRYPSLCVFGLEFMDEQTQEKLGRYVQAGGKLLIGPKVPIYDLSEKPCRILADQLGIKVTEQKKKEALYWKEIEFLVDFPIQVFEGNGLYTFIQTANGQKTAVKGKSGKGEWIGYGFGLNHTFDYQVTMVNDWMKLLRISKHIEIEPWDVHAVARWNKNAGFLFLFNYHDITKKGNLSFQLKLKDHKIIKFQKKFKLERRSSEIICLKLKNNKLVEVKK